MAASSSDQARMAPGNYPNQTPTAVEESPRATSSHGHQHQDQDQDQANARGPQLQQRYPTTSQGQQQNHHVSSHAPPDHLRSSQQRPPLGPSAVAPGRYPNPVHGQSPQDQSNPSISQLSYLQHPRQSPQTQQQISTMNAFTPLHFRYDGRSQQQPTPPTSAASNVNTHHQLVQLQQQPSPQSPAVQQQQHLLPDSSRRPSSSASAASSFPSPTTSAQSNSNMLQVYPAVAQNAVSALEPVQSLLEQVWSQSIQSVHQGMSRMHGGFMAVLEAERKRSEAAVQAAMRVQQERNAMGQEVQRLNSESDTMKRQLGNSAQLLKMMSDEIMKLKREVDALNSDNTVLRRFRDEGGERAGDLAKARQDVADLFKAELEKQTVSVLRDAQKEKALRIQAEQKLADAMQTLKQISGTVSLTPHQDEPVPVPDTPAPLVSADSPAGPVISPSQFPTKRPRISPVATRRQLIGQQSIMSFLRPPSAPALLTNTAPHEENHQEFIDLTGDESAADDQAARPTDPESSDPLPPPSAPASASEPLPPTTSTPVEPSPGGEAPDSLPRKRGRLEYEADGGAGSVDEERAASRVKEGPTPESRPHDIKHEGLAVAMGRRDASPILYPKEEAKREPRLDAVAKLEMKEDGLCERGVEGEDLEEGEEVESGGNDGVTTPPTPLQAPTSVRPRVCNKIGINHMDLLYETSNDRMVCRMCMTRDVSRVPPVRFPLGAAWPELVGHCQTEHPKAYEDLERLSPAQVAELRQRITSVKLSTPRPRR